MALTLREKAERQIGRLHDDINRLGPRYEKALKRVLRRREIYARQTQAAELAEARFAKISGRRDEALRYIAALEAAIAQSSESEDENAPAVNAAVDAVVTAAEAAAAEPIPADDEDDDEDEDESGGSGGNEAVTTAEDVFV